MSRELKPIFKCRAGKIAAGRGQYMAEEEKVTKKTSVAFGILKWGGITAGVLVLAAAVFILPMARTMMSFRPAPTGAVTPEFFAVNNKFVDFFVFKSGDELFCFDAGNSVAQVLEGFKELGLEPSKVKAVFLTHSDGDHVNGLPAFENAAVYLPAAEEPLVTGTKKRHFMFMEKINTLPVSKYTLIKDGERVKIGKGVCEAILTPGHTIGSTSFLVNGKYLIVGDLAIIKNGKLIAMPKPPSEDPVTAGESLKKAESIKGIEYIATAHAGFLKIPGN